MKSKFLAVSVVASMLFTGCSKNGIYGTYSFQMGKDNGFHLKAQMVLSNEDYVRESGEVDGKKFSFTIDIGTTEKALPKNLYRSDESDDVTDEEDNEDVYSDDDFDFLSLLPNPFTLDGHFKLGGLDRKSVV